MRTFYIKSHVNLDTGFIDFHAFKMITHFCNSYNNIKPWEIFSSVSIANGELYGTWNKLKQLSCRSSCKCVGMKEIRGEERDLIKYILFWNYSIIKILSIMSTDDIPIIEK